MSWDPVLHGGCLKADPGTQFEVSTWQRASLLMGNSWAFCTSGRGWTIYEDMSHHESISDIDNVYSWGTYTKPGVRTPFGFRVSTPGFNFPTSKVGAGTEFLDDFGCALTWIDIQVMPCHGCVQTCSQMWKNVKDSERIPQWEIRFQVGNISK